MDMNMINRLAGDSISGIRQQVYDEEASMSKEDAGGEQTIFGFGSKHHFWILSNSNLLFKDI
jgi:hypothetical protein